MSSMYLRHVVAKGNVRLLTAKHSRTYKGQEQQSEEDDIFKFLMKLDDEASKLVEPIIENDIGETMTELKTNKNEQTNPPGDSCPFIPGQHRSVLSRRDLEFCNKPQIQEFLNVFPVVFFVPLQFCVLKISLMD